MKAAEYIRMSTDYQCYSTVNQQAKIRDFAAGREMEVVRTYLDEGRSGLSLRGRPGLQALLADVTRGTDEFDAILVFDVSRWGRFQDLDEGAHYEYLCRSAGKRIIYCAEPFEGDSTPYGAIVKSLRRIMAREYSRDLSEKVFVGQSRLAKEGFHVGGAPGLGYQRLIVDREGRPKGVLGHKEYKARQDEHVILIPGPEEEIEAVREIFKWFARDHLNYTEITRRLNLGGVKPPPHISQWTTYVIRRMLSDEKYIGNNVYNRTTGRLRQTRTTNPTTQWIRCVQAFEPLIELSLFEAARVRAASDLRLVDPIHAQAKLQALREKQGRISVSLMRQAGLPDPTVYVRRFGSLKNAFHLAGYDYSVDYERISTQAWGCRRHRQRFVHRLIHSLAEQGERAEREGEYVLVLRGHFKVAVTFFRFVRRGWRFDQSKNVDATVCVRPAPSEYDDDCFLVAQTEIKRATVWVADANFEARFGRFRQSNQEMAYALRELLSSPRQTMRPQLIPEPAP